MDVNKFHENLIKEINENSIIAETTFEEEFFYTYANYLVENDEVLGEPIFLHFEMPLIRNQKAEISGYFYYEEDNELSLFLIDDMEFSSEVSTLNSSDADRLYKKARNYFSFAGEISINGEESNEAVNIADTLYLRKSSEYNIFHKLASVKIYIFTDKKLSRNLLQTEDEYVDNIRVTKRFVDIERIQSLSEARRGKVELEIDLKKFNPIPALLANETEEYESYLCNISGLTLANLYNEYGSRLIESNVRSFLQTRGKVNKGIRLTILKEPEKFFAYNNGLTCTASSIEISSGYIEKITGLQIVNGGQTTASLANVLINEKNGIEKLVEVSVPMKLNVIKDTEIEDELVANISRYANSQNKVSDVDLQSNHPFHKKIEELSRRTTTPAADGFSHGTYWYYERAAGQFAQETYKMSQSRKKNFLRLNPRTQMFKKSDFAKFFNIYSKNPDVASKGGVAAFRVFSKWIMDTWDKNPNSINQEFYKEMIANIIMFKQLDKITKLGAGANGYKANINAYTLSYLYWYIETKLGQRFDYSTIWKKQSVPEKVLMFLDNLSYKVRDILTTTEGNVTEYAKRKIAWDTVKKEITLDFGFDLSSICISKSEVDEIKRSAKKDEKMNNDLDEVMIVYKKMEEDPNYYKKLLAFIDKNKKEFIPKERSIIAMLATNKYLSDKQCKIALEVIEKADLEGFGVV